MNDSTITPQAIEAARERFASTGQSFRSFAAKHNIHAITVYEVLSGRRKCLRGDAHKAAVLLGLKQGTFSQAST